jgi:hypothetical protein
MSTGQEFLEVVSVPVGLQYRGTTTGTSLARRSLIIINHHHRHCHADVEHWIPTILILFLHYSYHT